MTEQQTIDRINKKNGIELYSIEFLTNNANVFDKLFEVLGKKMSQGDGGVKKKFGFIGKRLYVRIQAGRYRPCLCC